MRAISLWQPWATAMALGLKWIETRHWATSYRGPMVIHAAKRWTRDERETLEVMREMGHFPARHVPIPLGAIVAMGRLVDIKRTEMLESTLGRTELEWGNYGPRRYGWIFEDIVPLAEPIPFRGMQGLFDIPETVLRGEVIPSPKPGPTPEPPRQGAFL